MCWAWTSLLDRVRYTPLSPRRQVFELITLFMRETGVVDRDIAFEEYVYVQCAEGAKHKTAWKYDPGSLAE